MDTMWTDTPCTLKQYLQSMEREILFTTLESCKHNHTKAAAALSLTFRAYRYRAETLGTKGGTRSGYQGADKTRNLGPHWPKLRMDALRRYGNRCQCCGAGPSDGVVLQVDHVKPRHMFPSLEFNLDNLQVLCASCHMSKGAFDQTDWRP